jgi:hypothetical protein
VRQSRTMRVACPLWHKNFSTLQVGDEAPPPPSSLVGSACAGHRLTTRLLLEPSCCYRNGLHEVPDVPIVIVVGLHDASGVSTAFSRVLRFSRARGVLLVVANCER